MGGGSIFQAKDLRYLNISTTESLCFEVLLQPFEQLNELPLFIKVSNIVCKQVFGVCQELDAFFR